jgi:hypothetical protein
MLPCPIVGRVVLKVPIQPTVRPFALKLPSLDVGLVPEMKMILPPTPPIHCQHRLHQQTALVLEVHRLLNPAE